MEDLALSIHIHTIDRTRHRDFLKERRKDTLTKQELKAGDRIVFYAGCKSAFLLDSWKGMGNKHCKQTETLAELPIFKSIFVDPKLKAEVELLRIRNQELESEKVKLPRVRKSKNLESR